jgi:hypothetical protein
MDYALHVLFGFRESGATMPSDIGQCTFILTLATVGSIPFRERVLPVRFAQDNCSRYSIFNRIALAMTFPIMEHRTTHKCHRMFECVLLTGT